MKAREIKKSLIQDRDKVIKEYDTALKRNALELEAKAVELRQLNQILLRFFNVNSKYVGTISEDKPTSIIEREIEPEVDDVPF